MFDTQIKSRFGHKHKLSFHHSQGKITIRCKRDQLHELSPDCETIIDILHPDVDYGSDSDSDELTYTDE